MNTLTEENYLKGIFHLTTDGNSFTINELSKYLKLKMPTVNNMMKKFADKNWVIYESYKPLLITDLGKKEAALIVRKHRLTEMFLVEKMNFGWENVHEIAEQLEHIKSPIFFDKIDEILNFPKLDPHGEPIPDKNGDIISQDLKKLSQCSENTTVVFSAVKNSSEDFLNFLNDKKLILGTEILVEKVEKFDGSMTVLIRKKRENLSQMVCENLLVKE